MVFDRKKWRKKYYLQNKDKERKSNKEYYQKNKDKWKDFPSQNLSNPEIGRYRKKKSLKWREDNREKHNALMREQYKKNKKKWHARSIAQKIKIPKNQICGLCKKNKALERHHEDYDEPKEVNFVCKKCHRTLHKKVK